MGMTVAGAMIATKAVGVSVARAGVADTVATTTGDADPYGAIVCWILNLPGLFYLIRV
jgi:hypothetical protein